MEQLIFWSGLIVVVVALYLVTKPSKWEKEL
jgi:hypothetical protein